MKGTFATLLGVLSWAGGCSSSDVTAVELPDPAVIEAIGVETCDAKFAGCFEEEVEHRFGSRFTADRTYNDCGKVIEEHTQTFVSSWSYDEQNRLVQSATIDVWGYEYAGDAAYGAIWSYAYDGLTRDKVDGFGRVVERTTYDTRGNIVATDEASGLLRTYAYNASDQVIVFDEYGPFGSRRESYRYDQQGRLTQVFADVDEVQSVTEIDYAGYPWVSSTFRSGDYTLVATERYDEQDRLVQRFHTNGPVADLVMEYEYDDAGRLVGVYNFFEDSAVLTTWTCPEGSETDGVE